MGYLFCFLTLGLAWLAVGAILMLRGKRPIEAPGLLRRISKPVVAVGEELEVELTLLPPISLGQLPDHDLVLVLDRSGSTGSGPASRLGEALRATETFLHRCPDQLRIGLVTFHHQAERTQPLGNSRAVGVAFRGLRGEGGTAIDLALDRCREECLENRRPGVPMTVLLLSDGYSDPARALIAAESLRRAVPDIQICAAALGTNIHRQLLAELAGGDENVFPVSSERDFDRLFGFLARRLAAGTATLSLAADEGARVPNPFRLLDATPIPAGVNLNADPHRRATRLQWELPVLDPHPVRFTYRLLAECPGWHAVATDCAVAWSMADGTTSTVVLPAGPRVLVLPPLLKWAWPILHPLVFLLVGERFCAGVGTAVATAAPPAAAPLPSPSLPAALPAVAARNTRPDVGPTLVIGLGELGETALCRLRHRLDDRGVPPDRVVLRWIGLEQGRPARAFGGMTLRPDECLRLACDFYPYLEGLRRDGAPITRAWIPWQAWLASSRPQTAAAEPDRRRARLAVLHQSDCFENFLRPAVKATIDREGAVVLLGSLDDSVASGLAGEVAHLCAACGARTTLLLAAEQEPRLHERAALARELARFLLLRGDAIPSDRTSPPALASRLVDRLAIIPATGETASTAAAEVLYALLAFRSVGERIPTATTPNDQPTICRADLEAVVWPEEHLWRWVCDRTLVRDVAVAALRWNLSTSSAEPSDREAVDRWVRAFWSGAGTRRPASVWVREGPALLQGRSVEAVLLACLPFAVPVHEQVTFHRNDRRLFFGYLDDWCRRLSEEERGRGRCGLMLLAEALTLLETDHQRLVAAAEGLLGHPTLAELGRLGADLLADQRLVVKRLCRLVQAHRAQWAGPRDSVAARLVAELIQAERALGAVLALDALRPRAETWADKHGSTTRARLAFEVSLDLETGNPALAVRIGEQTLAAGDDPIPALRGELARYRGTIDDTWFAPSGPHRVPDPRQALQLGGRAHAVFPDLGRSLEEADPRYAGAIAIEEVALEEALGVVEQRGKDLPFVWPEEANAQRLANWLRQPPIKREPRPWPPKVVHLLREPEKLYRFLGDLALGRLERCGDHWGLRSGDQWHPVAEVAPDATASAALERFEAMARRVVAIGVSLDGSPLQAPTGPRWSPDPLVAAEQVEGHPAVAAAIAAPGWAVWRDVIESLVLEQAHRTTL